MNDLDRIVESRLQEVHRGAVLPASALTREDRNRVENDTNNWYHIQAPSDQHNFKVFAVEKLGYDKESFAMRRGEADIAVAFTNNVQAGSDPDPDNVMDKIARYLLEHLPDASRGVYNILSARQLNQTSDYDPDDESSYTSLLTIRISYTDGG